MKNMFEASFFGAQGLHGYAPLSQSIALRGPFLEKRLGQDTTPSPGRVAPTDQSDIAGMTSGIQDLLKQLPPELLGPYNARYQKCENDLNAGLVGTVVAGKCLYDLYVDLQKLFKNGPPKPAAVALPAPTPFPVLPVVIGVLGLGVLIWALARPKSDPVPAPVSARVRGYH